MKITTRCGEQAVAGLNEVLLDKAGEAKLIRLGKVRADTTVVSANVDYPTDSGLLAKAIGKTCRIVRRVKATGGGTRTAFRDRSRAARRRVRVLASKLHLRGAQNRDEVQQTVLRISGELADLAEHVAGQANVVLCNAKLAQTRRRLAGDMPESAHRIVSLHNPDARPIAKGRINRPVEFGYKAQIVDNEDGIVVDYDVQAGNPPDAPQLAPAIARIKARTGKAPRSAPADRGHGEAKVDSQLHDLGVKTVAIPRKGKPGTALRAQEHKPGFRRLLRWRTGSEGRISHLKHRYGWARTRIDGLTGTRTWCGHGILANNLLKIATRQPDNQQSRHPSNIGGDTPTRHVTAEPLFQVELASPIGQATKMKAWHAFCLG